ncbi:RE1, partial [Symbiodinium microadriaticum]
MDAPRLAPPPHDGPDDIFEFIRVPGQASEGHAADEVTFVNPASLAGCLPDLFLHMHLAQNFSLMKNRFGCAGHVTVQIEFLCIDFAALITFVGFYVDKAGTKNAVPNEAREAAESEPLTLDPCVTPSETGSQPEKLSRRQRRSRKQAAAKANDTAEQEIATENLDTIKKLRKLLKDPKADTDGASWSSLKGPERGVRWRGGTPPAPPKWQYAKDDLRAFSKYERKVNIWLLQVKPYMSDAEAALTLYCSLTGEAEEELEHIDLEKLYAKNGVAFLLEQLRGPLQSKQVYLKRKFLADFETVSRYNGEGMRSYVNRYHRAEKALLSIGINVSLTYDSESRGSRLLDRAKLTLEQQRMVLVGTGQSLHFDEIKNALVLQYPDHKPPPFVQGQPSGKDAQIPRAPKGKGKGYKGPTSFSSSGHGSSATSSSTPPRRAWVAEAEDNGDNDDGDYLDVIPEGDNGEGDEALDQGDDGDDGEELLPDEGDDAEGAIQELMQVLTVTSKKLQSMTQGRKYRGAPRKSVEERKRSSACSACGQIGHWAGDPECAMSAKGKGKSDAGKGSKGSTTSGNDKKGSGTSAQKVFSVRHSGGHEVLYAFDSHQHSPQGRDDRITEVHRSLVVFQSAAFDCMTSATEMQGYCVVDTACQRSCCSRAWCVSQQELLRGFGLEALFTTRSEAFQFGAGAPQRSSTCMYFPVAFEASQPLIALGASILDGLDIPFLASLSLLKKLGVVLDLCKQKAFIGLLNCTVDLFLVQGHLCLKNSEYPADVAFDWEAQDTHDCEFLCDSRKCTLSSSCTHAAPQAQESTSTAVQDAVHPANMARELEARGEKPQADDYAGAVCDPSCLKDRPGQASSGKHRRWHGKAGGDQEKAEAGACEPAEALRSRSSQAPRQCPGSLHDLRGLPMPLEMGRRRRWCNPWVALSSVIQIACAALTFGRDGAGPLVDPGSSLLIDDAGGLRQDATSASSDFGDFKLRVPWCARDSGDREQQQRGGQLRLGDGAGTLIRGIGPAPLKKGQWKRAVHNFEKTFQLLNGEVGVYNQWPGDLHLDHKADLLEVFWDSNAARERLNYSLASAAEGFGLSFVNLQGLELDHSPELLLQIASQIKPRVLCVHGAAKQSAHVKIAIQKCCELQVMNSSKFIVDFNPDLHEDVTGALFKICELPETCKASLSELKDHEHNEAGTFSFVTNCRCLLHAGNHHQHDLANVLLQCIQNEVRMMCPWKFDAHPHEVWYAPPVDAPEEWMSFLESLEKRLGRSRYYYMSEDSQEMRRLKQLVPWELTRAQVYANPVTRRLPPDVPYTHRGAAMILNDGQLMIESEDLSEVRQPRLRFSTPVRIAVFFYGIAEDDKSQKPEPRDTPDVHVPGLRTDISFPGLPDTIPKEVRSAVARLHCNAGHPPRQELVRLLAAHGTINAAVLTTLEHLKCGTCERARGPLKPRPASVPEFVGQFAEQLQADVFYVRDLSSTNHALLGVTCLATKLYQAAILVSRDPQVVLNEFDRLWLRPYGYPLFMSVDADGAFEGVFLQHLQESGVLVNVVPADGHHQVGAIERKNAVFRTVLERLIDQNGVTSKEQLDLCISAAIWAVNSSIHTRGRSSLQAVFGKLPRLPGDLLSDSAALATSDYHLLTEQLRSQACQAVAEMSASSVIRRALLRKTATSRARVNELLPGAMVAYWRWNLKARGRKRGGYILGRLVVKDEKNAWVQSGGSLVQVTQEQLRPAIGIEMWTPSPTVSGKTLVKPDLLLTNLLNQLYKLFLNKFWVQTVENKPRPDNTNYHQGGNNNLYRNLKHNKHVKRQLLWHYLFRKIRLNPWRMRRLQEPTFISSLLDTNSRISGSLGKRTKLGLEAERAPGQEARLRLCLQLRNNLSYNHLHRANRQRPDSPRLHDDVLQSSGYKPKVKEKDQQPKCRHLQHHQQPNLDNCHQFLHLFLELRLLQTFRFHLTFRFQQNRWAQASEGQPGPTTEEAPTSIEASGESLPSLPAKRTHEALSARKASPNDYHSVLLTNFLFDNLAEIFVPNDGWDGSPDYHDGPPCCAFRCAAAKLEETEVSSDSSDDEETRPLDTLSRQERKAIDREIPWRKLISDFPPNVVDLYVKANKKEFDSWNSWGSIRPVPADEARKIRTDPVLRRRIMPSRNAYRDKNRGAGPEIKAKCRTVIQGCHDPDLGLLDRSSPTPTRLAELLIYEIACAGYNRRLQMSKKAWKLWCGDVSTAFLQGQPQARDKPIFMRPPRDEIQKMAQTFLHELYEVVGNLYGLCNAPRTWINHIVSKLVEANFKRHRLDHTVYYKFDHDGELLIILLFHVDDFLVAFREDYDFDELSKMFTWGQTNLLDDGEFVFKGKEVKLVREGNEFKIKVTQKAFIKELTPGKLPRGRLDKGDKLTADEFKEYRSCAGSLQWLGGSTRPDICASVSLSNLGQDNGPEQLKMLYECIDYIKGTSEDGLTFHGVSLNYATHVIGYGDSSWANAPGGKSQMGVIVVLAGPECKDKIARATIVDWRSSRSPRVTRSTLASEANAMDECVDRCTFCNCFLSELLGGKKVTPEQLKTTGMLPQLQITDCKSLYDAVIADNPATSEKRTTISIRSIQDFISPEQAHWVPTTLMHADVLTKHSVSLRDGFIDWLRNPTVQLVELEESVHRKENFSSVNVQL